MSRQSGVYVVTNGETGERLKVTVETLSLSEQFHDPVPLRPVGTKVPCGFTYADGSPCALYVHEHEVPPSPRVSMFERFEEDLTDLNMSGWGVAKIVSRN